MSDIIETTTEGEVVDNYAEHELHQVNDEQCSECYKFNNKE